MRHAQRLRMALYDGRSGIRFVRCHHVHFWKHRFDTDSHFQSTTADFQTGAQDAPRGKLIANIDLDRGDPSILRLGDSI